MVHNPDANYSARIAIASAGIVINMLLIIFIYSKRRRNLPFDITLISLAVADFVVSFLTAMSYTLLLLYIHGKIGLPYLHEIIVLNTVGAHLTISSSILHLNFIAIQRLLVILSPISSRRLTKASCIKIIVSIWLLSATHILIIIFREYRIYVVLSYLIIVSAAILIFSYSVIFYRLTKPANLTTTRATADRRRSASYYCLAITLAFLVCSLPFAVSSILRDNTSVNFQIAGDLLLYLNATLDPIIYLVWECSLQRRSGNRFSFVFNQRRIGNMEMVQRNKEQRKP